MIYRFGDIISEQLKNLGCDATVREWSAVWLWKKIVGEKLASVSRADKVKGRVLYVSVKNSSWAHHLSLMKREFLERINAVIGQNLIEDIRFTVTYYSRDPLHRTSPSAEDTRSKSNPCLDEIDLSEEAISEIRQNASTIADETLRSLFEKVQLADRKRKEWITRHGGSKCVICNVPVLDSDMCPVCSIKKANTW